MQRFVDFFLYLEMTNSLFPNHFQVTKGREQLEEARRTYEILNTELHDELPALHDSRILFLVTNLQTLFASEQVFHSETSKVHLSRIRCGFSTILNLIFVFRFLQSLKLLLIN